MKHNENLAQALFSLLSFHRYITAIFLLTLSIPAMSADMNMTTYKGNITVINDAPMNGTCFTPPWIGIHDGSFDTYNGDEPLPRPLESLVDDGNNAPVIEYFAAANGTVRDVTVGDGPICLGESASLDFEFEVETGMTYYISYASMILPSNDAWVSNGNPEAYPVIDEMGDFLTVVIDVLGGDVLDASTEVNDKLPANTVSQVLRGSQLLCHSAQFPAAHDCARFLFRRHSLVRRHPELHVQTQRHVRVPFYVNSTNSNVGHRHHEPFNAVLCRQWRSSWEHHRCPEPLVRY